MPLLRRLGRQKRNWLLRYCMDVEDDLEIISAQLSVAFTLKFNRDCTYRIVLSLVNILSAFAC